MLDTVNSYQCMSNESWEMRVRSSDGHRDYIVSYGKAPYWSVVDNDFSCTCEAFKFKKTYCKHIKQVAHLHCGWIQYIHGGEPVIVDGKKSCPRCHGPLKSISYGV